MWLFTSAGVLSFSAPAGCYGNKATVTARDSADKVVSDDDVAFHFGVVVRPNVKKYVNGQDADRPRRVRRRRSDASPGRTR